MIRDLRAAQWRTTTPPSRSLAFARNDIARGTTVSSVLAGAKTERALTVAVTAPRLITCKRGFAANFAAQLAARVTGGGSSVCLVDTDLESATSASVSTSRLRPCWRSRTTWICATAAGVSPT
jgi:hypothetical protein